MASVTFEHVWKKFGDFTALNDLDIQIADKEFLVLVGPSGCGKTTALRCLAGLEEISQGKVLIADQVVNDVAPKDRDIAMVFQSYALYPHMTVFDNMAFGLKLRKVPKADIKRRVEDAAQTLGIEHLLKKRPDLFSPGDWIVIPDAGNEDGTMIEIAEKSILWVKAEIIGGPYTEWLVLGAVATHFEGKLLWDAAKGEILH